MTVEIENFINMLLNRLEAFNFQTTASLLILVLVLLMLIFGTRSDKKSCSCCAGHPEDKNHANSGIKNEESGCAGQDETQADGSTSVASGLKRTRESFFSKVRAAFQGKSLIDEELLEELEAALISSDLGVALVSRLMQELKDQVKKGDNIDQKSLIEILKKKITEILLQDEKDNPLQQLPADVTPYVVMLVGVNGAGKTTTVAKLADSWQAQGKKVLLAAADTFRAAAGEQLEVWAERLGITVVKGADKAKPATVVFEAMQKAVNEKFDVLLIDTAGRLQTQTNLMQELGGISNMVKRFDQNAPQETLLVIDGTTGQNALSQVKEFNAVVPLTGVVVTKLDGTPKGGIVVAVKSEFGLPVRFIGVGEKAGDLKVFKAEDFVDALFVS